MRVQVGMQVYAGGHAGACRWACRCMHPLTWCALTAGRGVPLTCCTFTAAFTAAPLVTVGVTAGAAEAEEGEGAEVEGVGSGEGAVRVMPGVWVMPGSRAERKIMQSICPICSWLSRG